MADGTPNPNPKPIEQTAKEVKEDLNKGNLSAGTDALRQGYLDWMKAGKEDGQFWSQLKTTGHFTDADMRNLSLGFAQKQFKDLSDDTYTGARFISAESLDKHDSTLRSAGNTPESQFGQKMDSYLRQALNNDSTFNHNWWGLSQETNFHGTGKYIGVDTLNDRISELNTDNQGRAQSGGLARALDTKGAEGRTLFERMANGSPSILPADIRHANENIGAYAPAEQATIRSMIKGMDNSSSPEGIAMAQLQNPNQSNKITRQSLDAIEAATAPVEQPKATAPAAAPADAAKKEVEALVALSPEQRTKIAPDNKLTHQSVDAFLNDANNKMSLNQRTALGNLRDSLPADNAPTSLGDLAKAGGYATADGNINQQAMAKIPAEIRGTMGGLHDNVTAASVTDQKGAITPESVAARMKAMSDAAAQPGGAPVAGNSEYQALQRLQNNFNDISADGKSITADDFKRYAASGGQDTSNGIFKGDAPQQPAPPVVQPVPTPGEPVKLPDELKKQAELDAQNAMKATAVTTEHLGTSPLFDQATAILQKRGGQPTPQEARQLLADMAKLNKWPGTEEQWGRYVGDGQPSHLPKELNYAMRANMEMKVPSTAAAMSPEDRHKAALAAAANTFKDLVPPLNLDANQVAAIKAAAKDQIPGIVQATPEQLNDFAVANAQRLGDVLRPDQQKLVGQRNAYFDAYTKAVEEAMQKVSPAQPQEAPAKAAPPPKPEPQPPKQHQKRRQQQQ